MAARAEGSGREDQQHMQRHRYEQGADESNGQEDDESGSRKVCVDCGKRAPEADSNYTLISARHGWRLTRTMVDGLKRYEWRCPSCYAFARLSLRRY